MAIDLCQRGSDQLKACQLAALESFLKLRSRKADEIGTPKLGHGEEVEAVASRVGEGGERKRQTLWEDRSLEQDSRSYNQYAKCGRESKEIGRSSDSDCQR